MKYMILTVVVLSLNSCNTCIGVWRDTCQGYQWTKGKMQGEGGGNEVSPDPYNDPVY